MTSESQGFADAGAGAGTGAGAGGCNWRAVRARVRCWVVLVKRQCLQ